MLSEAPQWLLDIVCDQDPEPIDSVPSFDLNAPLTEADRDAADRETQRLLVQVRTAKEGSRNATLNVAAFVCGKMVGAGALSEFEIESLLLEAAQSAGLAPQEARSTIRSGLLAGKRKPWRPFANDEKLTLLNRDYFFALDGKTTFVFREETDSVTNRRSLERIYPGSFKELFGNEFVMRRSAEGELKAQKLGIAWLAWKGRRQYDRVVFNPGRDLPPNIYNQWPGFSFDAVEGDCGGFLDFVFTIICGGDTELYSYLLAWCARCVQQPWAPGEVAVVFRGSKGIGKSFFAEHLGEAFGDHCVVVTNSKHLIGNFNAHLETAVLVFADEAFWAGDKQNESTLKGLITGKHLFVERKGVDGRGVLNHTHLIMASNSDWVVPASLDERRFCVVNVSSARKNDHDYFANLEADWQGGAREAFLHHLLTLDISNFNVRDVPQTRALLEQKMLSLGPVDRWYLSSLEAGQIGGDGWVEWMPTELLYATYRDFCEKERARTGSREAFGMRFAQLLPTRPDGKSARRQRQQTGGKREWGYELGTLAECRKRFEAVVGFEIEWDTPGDVSSAPKTPY